MDTKHRTPNYYLFWAKEDDMNQEDFNKMTEVWLAGKNKNPAKLAEAKEAENAGITDGRNSDGLLTREEGTVMALRAMKKAAVK